MNVETRRVFIVGDSLFAETLAQTLASAESVKVVGSAPTTEAALPQLRDLCPDAVIIVGEASPAAFGPFLAAYPDTPLIRTDLKTSEAQIIISQNISARSSDLLAAIAALPKRSQTHA